MVAGGGNFWRHPMGSNQVKAITSPFLHIESRALSYQDDQERIFKKGLTRRVGSHILAHWIQMKRREKAVVERAKVAVGEGRAPPDLLQEVEMYLAKDSEKPHIKYHPTILPKKSKSTRSRLKGPKLNQTAARRIKDSYERRERELRESSEGETSQRSKSRVSVRSHGWTDRTTLGTAATVKSQSQQQKRASSLPPSSTLSLQSITTAESSGIGMSRASSMTSVASSRHRTFYTRQRARSLDLGETSPTGSQEAQGDETGTTGRRRGAGKTERGQQKQGERSKKKQEHQQRGKSGWKHMCLAALKRTRLHKQEEERKLKQERHTGDTSRHRPQPEGTAKLEAKQGRPQQETSPQKSQEGERRQVHYVTAESTTPQSDDIEEIQLSQHSQETDEWAHQQTEKQLKEKKEQASQTRLSGPPRPRRLLLLRPGRNKIETSEQNQARAETSNGRAEHRLSPDSQDQAVAGPSRRPSQNRVSPDMQETRPRTSQREASGISRDLTPNTRQKKSIDLSLPHVNQNPTTRTSQEQKPKSSKTLEIARKMSRKWKRATSLDFGRSENRAQQNQALGRTQSHSEYLDSRNPEITQQQVHSGRSSHSIRQEGQIQESSSTAPERRSGSYLCQPPQNKNMLPIRLQNEDQTEPVQSQSGNQRRYSLSAEQICQLPLITREHHQRSRSIDTVRQVGLSGSRNYNPSRRSVEVQSTSHLRDTGISEAGVRREQHETVADERFYLPVPPRAQENDASDYEFEDTVMDDQMELPPGHSFDIGTAEVQVEGPIARSMSMDEVHEMRARGMVDQVRTVEAQGCRRPYSFSDHERKVENKGAGKYRGRSRERGRTTHDRRIVRGSGERVPQRTSVDGVRHSQSVDLGSPERSRRHYSLEQINNDYDRTRGGYDQLSERRYQTASLDRVRREPYAEYTRHDPATDYSRYEGAGRGGEYRYSRTFADREYPVGYIERGYVSESPEPRYLRADLDRRYTVGSVEPNYLGPYSERSYFSRSVDNNFTRGYLDRGYNARSLDNEYYRGYMDRTYLPGRIMESDTTYPDRIIAARRWKNDDEWGRGDSRRYREAIIAPHSTSLSASSPPVDHRAL